MSRRPCSRGFTLVELVIVLAILAAITSLAWPNLRRMSAKGQLQEAARQLRLAVAQARLSAIETGEVRLLRYQPETGNYQVISPQTGNESGGEATEENSLPEDSSSLSASEDALSTESGGWDDSEDPEETAERLPPGIVFLSPEAGEEPPSAAGEEALESPVAIEETGAGGALDGSATWAAPVPFYPNGRTAEARFRLGDGRRYYIDVFLRGLTGTVRLGPVERYATGEENGLEEAGSAATAAETESPPPAVSTGEAL